MPNLFCIFFFLFWSKFMKVYELIFLGLGISMDAFAVSLCKGLSSTERPLKTSIICAAWFTIFQLIFPTLGYFVGSIFEKYISQFDHWITFAIFLILGLNLIKEAFSKKSENIKSGLDFKSMFFISLATSLDSLMVGVTFALANMNILIPLLIIGLLTFLTTIIGVFVGFKFGKKYKKQATFAGGIILILLGIEILLQHLFF